MRLSSHAGAGPRRMASHQGGGVWPGGVGGLPPSPFGGGGSLFGDGSYSGNVMQGGSVLMPVAGVLTVTGAATVVPDLVTFSCMVLCDWLIVDGAGASLSASTNNKGLIVYAKSGIQCLNGGRIHNDKLGKAGNFGNLTAYNLTPASLQRTLKKTALETYVVLGEGAAGGPGGNAGISENGDTGAAASAIQSGGGGGGQGGSDAYSWHAHGATGGKGGPCCGGGGGGGAALNYTTGNGIPPVCADYGAGGDGAQRHTTGGYYTGGGAGDPPGTGYAETVPASPGVGAGGGLLMLFAPLISIASGCVVSADGGTGGTSVSYSGCGGGGAGGGVLVLVTLPGGYTNNGTVRASGGPGGGGRDGSHGGAGGAGSVNILTA